MLNQILAKPYGKVPQNVFVYTANNILFCSDASLFRLLNKTVEILRSLRNPLTTNIFPKMTSLMTSPGGRIHPD